MRVRNACPAWCAEGLCVGSFGQAALLFGSFFLGEQEK